MAQGDLPGLENREIQVLSELAEEYCKKRDRRMKILGEEVELKTSLLKEMKKRKKDVYDYEDVHIEIVAGEDSVKVRVRKPKEEEAAIQKP